jgi:prolipoprotein diacylglyceryltransferase
MNRLLLYYLQILVPFPFMYFVAKRGDSNLFAILVIIYIIYRFFIDYFRLKNKGILKKINVLTFLFLHYKYFRELYLEP